MLKKRKQQRIVSDMMGRVWGANIFLLAFLAIAYFVGFETFFEGLKTSVNEYRYQNVKSDKFDGTVPPIAYVPNWLDDANLNKSLRYESLPTDAFVETPRYDAELLRVDDSKNRIARLQRATYITPYMGSYRMNFEEYDGSHPGVDIRAVLGTPVVAVANGVVVKTVEKETADGIYVVLRHDEVPLADGSVETLFSSYLHLESISVKMGEKVRKGQQIGRVGMTGITTTPHLHFQIDRASAQSHVYWPYSTKDLNDLGIDFFAATNLGLGKENAIRNTVNPMQFVQESETVSYASSTMDVAVAAEPARNPVAPIPESSGSTESAPTISEGPAPQITEPTTQNPPPAPISVAVPAPDFVADTESAKKDAAPEASLAPSPFTDVELPEVADPVEEVKSMLEPERSPSLVADAPSAGFVDVPANARYAAAVDRLLKSGVFGVPSSGTFRPNEPVTRREAVLALSRMAKIFPEEYATSPFTDVSSSDAVSGVLARLVEEKIVGKAEKFRPADPLTRGEAAILLVRASGIAPDS